MSSSIKLDVGGTIFKTSRSTLTKYDSMFRDMLESGISFETDESGCVFIDRDPTHFRYILNFMEDGTVNLPENKDTIEEILKEAEFYSLQGLVELCHSPPPPLFTSTPLPSYHIIQNPGQLFEVLMNSSKTVLLYIYYPKLERDVSFLEMYFNQQFLKAVIAEFIDKHKDHVEFCFQSSDDWDFRCYSSEKIYDTEKISKLMNKKRNNLRRRMLNSSGGSRSIGYEKEAKSFFGDLEKWMCEQNFSN